MGSAGARCIGLLLMATMWCGQAGATTYLTQDQFIADNFDVEPAIETLWLTPQIQQTATGILGHPYRSLRLRYFTGDGRTAWILDETGKERPITVGIVIDNSVVRRVEILAYRESRGGEVRHPSFMSQFIGHGLNSSNELAARIDGITGATLSVRAVTNVVKFALYLHGLHQLQGRTQ
jgi:hypothetical protein